MTNNNTAVVCSAEGCKAKLPASLASKLGGVCPMHKGQGQVKQQPVTAPKVSAEYVVCVTDTCNAKLPVTLAEKAEGKCPKCAGQSQASVKPVRSGMVRCTCCSAQIPASKVQEWGGKCPKCNGGNNPTKRERKGQQFSSVEEFKAAQQQQAPSESAVSSVKALYPVPAVERLMEFTKEEMITRTEKWMIANRVLSGFYTQEEAKEFEIDADTKKTLMRMRKEDLAYGLVGNMNSQYAELSSLQDSGLSDDRLVKEAIDSFHEFAGFEIRERDLTILEALEVYGDITVKHITACKSLQEVRDLVKPIARRFRKI